MDDDNWFHANVFLYIAPELLPVIDFLKSNMFNYFPEKKILLLHNKKQFSKFITLFDESHIPGIIITEEPYEELPLYLEPDPLKNELLIAFTGWKPEETKILTIQKKEPIFGIIIGYQKPYTNPKILKTWLERGNEAFRLGEIWDNMEKISPALNDANVHFINWNNLLHNPIEGVQWDAFRLNNILWSSGISNNLRVTIIHNVSTYFERDIPLIAQALWHFINGVFSSFPESPFSSWVEDISIVFKGNPLNVVFKRSRRSGRWWAGQNKHFVSVLQEDYETARSKGTLPERWLAFIRRKGVLKSS